MKNKFSKNNLIVMSLGNIVGSGIFLGSSAVIQACGPSAFAAYLGGGILMAFEVMFITEMCVINPAPGAFREHATEIFGPWIGFVNGWMFWLSGVLGMAGEAAASAMFMRYWFPFVPVWIFCAGFSILMTLVNFCDNRGLGRIEGALASIKVVALAAFILFGALTVAGLFHPRGFSLQNPFRRPEMFAPHGLKGILSAMVMVMFSYTGTGIVGLGIAETENPGKNAPKALAVITTVVPLLFSLSTLLVVVLTDWKTVNPAISPFVTIMDKLRIPFSGSILNFIVLTASLSGLNSSMFSSSRMLTSLSADGQAPRVFARKTKSGVPSAALALSCAALVLAALLSFYFPGKVFIILASSSGFLALFNWLTISVTHYFYRKKTLREHPEKIQYRAPGYPFSSWAEAAVILLIFAVSPLYPGQFAALVCGVLLFVSLAVLYFVLKNAGRIK